MLIGDCEIEVAPPPQPSNVYFQSIVSRIFTASSEKIAITVESGCDPFHEDVLQGGSTHGITMKKER